MTKTYGRVIVLVCALMAVPVMREGCQELSVNDRIYSKLSGLWVREGAQTMARRQSSSEYSWGKGDIVSDMTIIADLRADEPYVNFAGIPARVVNVKEVSADRYVLTLVVGQDSQSSTLEWRLGPQGTTAEYGPHPRLAFGGVFRVYKIGGPGPLWSEGRGDVK